jgi:hypothetical protein
MLGGALLNTHRRQIVSVAAKSRLPAMYYDRASVDAGGLVSYGVSFTDLFRRADTYVDKILKGRTPQDLPVEQPMKFEFIINLKAAKKIGLTIPPNVLVRANKVIGEEGNRHQAMVGADLCVRPFGGPTRRSAPTRVQQSEIQNLQWSDCR